LPLRTFSSSRSSSSRESRRAVRQHKSQGAFSAFQLAKQGCSMADSLPLRSSVRNHHSTGDDTRVVAGGQDRCSRVQASREHRMITRQRGVCVLLSRARFCKGRCTCKWIAQHLQYRRRDPFAGAPALPNATGVLRAAIIRQAVRSNCSRPEGCSGARTFTLVHALSRDIVHVRFRVRAGDAAARTSCQP
jgi:hypothetical protein